MNKILLWVVSSLLICTNLFAQDINISLKQGFVYKLKGQQIRNLTTIELAKTKAVDNFGKWNILWAGWSMDLGWAYDANSVNTGALLLGREFGTLGNYLPIDFPLKEKINITLYPIGLYAEDLFDHPKTQGCIGVGIIKLSIKF
jgi:hypothetical protein